jgi:hypothetical protein
MSTTTKQRIKVCVAVERTTYYAFEVEAKDETEATDLASDYLFDWEEIALGEIDEQEETTSHYIFTGDEAL